MATYNQIKNYLNGLPGVNVYQQEEVEHATVGIYGGNNFNERFLDVSKRQVTLLIDLKQGRKMITFFVYVSDPGTGSEEAFLETPIPELFQKEVESFIAGVSGVLNYKIDEIDEVNRYAVVTGYFENTTPNPDIIEGRQYFIYDQGTITSPNLTADRWGGIV